MSSAFRLHSDPSASFEALPTFQSVLEHVEETAWGAPFFASLRDQVRETITESERLPPDELSTAAGFEGAVAELAVLLERRLRAVLVLVPSKRAR